MKKMMMILALLGIAMAGSAQSENDLFDVGPYEVLYKGVGDYQVRLRKGIDLYEYFDLKRDTTIVNPAPAASQPVDRAWQLALQYGLHGYGLAGSTSKLSVAGNYKQRIGAQLFFNAGVSVALGLGDYGELWDNMSETMLEAGIPLSLELADIDREQASLYGLVGVTPAFFTSMGSSTDSGIDAYDGQGFSKSGFFLAPAVGLGVYVPAWGQLIRIGVFAQHHILFKDFDSNVYARRIGRTVLGAEVGIVF